MKRMGSTLVLLAAVSFAAAPAFAQSSNEGKPAAPAPSKAAPMETGGKPKTEGGAMMKKSSGGMKSSAMMKKRKHK